VVQILHDFQGLELKVMMIELLAKRSALPGFGALITTFRTGQSGV